MWSGRIRSRDSAAAGHAAQGVPGAAMSAAVLNDSALRWAVAMIFGVSIVAEVYLFGTRIFAGPAQLTTCCTCRCRRP
ncbi:hypothetical protein I546_0140 [Mycobacterium kansasii 732]|nr:hypothetical protein I546_0140 [Mycobacterium kansasii 732]